VAAVFVVAPALAVSACESTDAAIGTDAVRRATVVEVVDVPASVTARAVATLTAPADGRLTRLSVEPGQSVARGAVVAVIDSPTARRRLADARAALDAARRVGVPAGTVDLSGLQRGLDAAADDAFAAARSAAEKVADEAVRDALLAHVDAAAESYAAASRASRRIQRQVQRGLAGISDAVAALGAAQRAQAKGAYDLAKATVDALTLRAPIAGVVQYARPAVAASADPLAGLLGAVGAAGGVGASGVGGAAAGAGSGGGATVAGVDDVLAVGDRLFTGDAVVTIVDVSEIGLQGEVDETDVLLVSPGVVADVELDAAPGVRYRATVSTVDLLPTPSARGGVAYRIRLTLATEADEGQRPPTPRPGMSAVAHLRVRTAEAAVAVPASAVFTSEIGDTVWVLRDGRAQRQRVEVGVQGEDLVEIRAGVAPGDRVVITGTDRVSAGQELS
jgi:multidrug efflux pump subunit AcrA (membrane-fusion protein)